MLQYCPRPLGGARPPRSSRGAQVGAGGCAEGSWASFAALWRLPFVGFSRYFFSFCFVSFNFYEIAVVVQLFASEIREMPSRGIVNGRHTIGSPPCTCISGFSNGEKDDRIANLAFPSLLWHLIAGTKGSCFFLTRG